MAKRAEATVDAAYPLVLVSGSRASRVGIVTPFSSLAALVLPESSPLDSSSLLLLLLLLLLRCCCCSLASSSHSSPAVVAVVVVAVVAVVAVVVKLPGAVTSRRQRF